MIRRNAMSPFSEDKSRVNVRSRHSYRFTESMLYLPSQALVQPTALKPSRPGFLSKSSAISAALSVNSLQLKV